MRLPEIISFHRESHHNDVQAYGVAQPALYDNESAAASITLQCGGGAQPCGCGSGAPASYVYVFGDIRVVLPSQSVEKEFYQVAVTDPADKNRAFSNALAYKYLTRTENLYIARQMNWVFTIRGHFDLYILKVTTNRALSVLIETIAPYPGINYDILIAGKDGSMRRESTTGTSLPVVTPFQVYTITNIEYIKAIKAATGASDAEAAQMFSNSLSLTNNTGDEDKFRALNFIVLRYMTFYKATYDLLTNKDGKGKYDLVGVFSKPIEQFGKSKVIEIVFTYQEQGSSNTRSFSCTVDVSKEFPYITVGWSVYYKGI